MNEPLIDLITAWLKYSRQVSSPTVAEFCHFITDSEAGNKNAAPDKSQGKLLRAIGRIGSAYALYHKAAMAKMNLPGHESFYYLNGLATLGECKKMDLINYLFAEPTTGLDAVHKLLNAGLISERNDAVDRRAKYIKLTAKGKKKLEVCYSLSSKVNEMFFQNVSGETISMCYKLLSSIEEEHSNLAVKLKGKDFKTIYEHITSKELGGL